METKVTVKFPERKKKSVTFLIPQDSQDKDVITPSAKLISPPVPRPRKSLEKKRKPPPPGLNPFLTKCGDESCEVTLECGHECSALNCQKSVAEHSKADCTDICLRNCSRGHPCFVNHRCSDPCPPCPVDIKVNFECGHSFETPCSVPITSCIAVCGKKLSCGHDCPKLCSQPCQPCQTFCYGKHPCGHRFRVQCCVKDKANTKVCNMMVPCPLIPDCGHPVMVPCVKKNRFTYDDLAKLCKSTCTVNSLEYGGCGHPCDGICGQTCDNGIFHLRCKEPCGRINICGHICTAPCNKNCPPCQDKCQTACEHGRCDVICGIPCTPCKKPCVWECPHKKCTRLCNEVCDRDPCELPCPEVIKKCGHPCIGFCGETCPMLCRYCDRDELLGGFMGIRTIISEDDRFILLKDCGHVFPVDILDQWMEMVNETGEIHMKTCPLCRSIIWTCRRYNMILAQKREELFDIKVRVYGDLDKIEAIQIHVYREFIVSPFIRRRFEHYIKWILSHVSVEDDVDGQPLFVDMDKGKAACLEFLANQLDKVEVNFQRYATDYEDEEFNVMEHYYRELFYRIRSRGLPLSMTEMADLQRQENRIQDVSLLFDRQSPKRVGFLNIMTTRGALARYDACYDILTSRGPYTDAVRKDFKEALEKLDSLIRCQLGITEAEKKMIVNAFGTSIGRWFKCPNGHIYVVTECGGPTELGRCNECGASVGGENHRSIEGNALAVEMDGAEVPLYPTALTGMDMAQYVEAMLNEALDHNIAHVQQGQQQPQL